MAEPAPPHPPDRHPSGAESRFGRVVDVVALGMLAGMLLSPRLWLSSRLYPLCPVAGFWPTVPAPFDVLWFVILLALLVAVPLVRRPRGPIVLFVVLAGLLALGDQTRWQPWFYQYLLMLAALGLTRRPAAGGAGADHGLNACRLILAATYFWSGLQKFNHSFETDLYPWFLEPLQATVPGSLWCPIGAAGRAPAVVETAIGLGLLVPALRPLAIGAAVGMHAFLLFSLGPLGHNWNSVVWPWNIALILLAVRLFGGTRAVPLRAVVWPGRSAMHWLAMLLLGVLPAFSFWGRWDPYLSAALYSGNTMDAYMSVNPGAEDGEESAMMDWAIRELNVPPYPARRTYRHIARTLTTRGDRPARVVLTIHERPDAVTGEREVTVEVFGEE